MDTEEGTTEQLSQTAWERFSTYQSRMQAHAVFYALLNAVSALQKNVEELVLATLPSGKHPPALALFMAFLTLYRGAQEKINTFHQRHLEFYYRDVLHFSPQPCIADSTYLVFRLIPGVEQALIPAGTKFPATSPTDASKWLFRSEHDLLVNDIRVEALRTLYFERDCNVSPERELDYVTRIYAHAIPLSEEQEVRGRQSWSLFGSARMDGERPQGDPAHIGFALASPVLLLREGERKVDLALVFTAHSTAVQTITDAVAELCSTQTEKAFFHAFGRLFGAYLLAESDPLNSNCKKNILHWAKKIVAPHAYIVLANLLQKDRQDLFHALMQNLFLVDLTSKTGWYRVSGVAIRQMLTEGKNQLDGLSLSFTLGPEIGPITAYDVSLHGEGFSTRLPLIRLHLNPQAPFFACSLFDTLAVKKFHLTVNVKGIHQIQACNNHGNLDLDKPFHPFGPLPTTASFLIFGCYEAALKPLTRLRINLTWGDLPRDKEGFRSYYRSYNTKYSNEGFTTVPALLRDGHWTPAVAPSSDPIPLFVSVADSEQLSWQRRIDMTRLHHCRPLSSDFRESDYRYSPQTQNGFFKLPLTGPENAFGHALYPTLLSDTLTRNARSKLTRQQPMPQTPYTPIITRMTLDYIAQTVITAGIDQDTDASEDSEKPFHIHPFGVKTIRAHADRRFHRLLPSFNDDGNLLIGLNGTRPDGPLTLLFHLQDDSRRSTQEMAPRIRWWYLASNRWHRLGDGSILSDTTNGFLVSGMVMLDIPSMINRENSIMPDTLFWLRVSSSQGLDTFCSLIAVHAQTVRVSRMIDDSVQVKQFFPIPPGTIRDAQQNLDGIGSISQPLPSSGGCGLEQVRRMNTRISERLRHKNRALTPWDYERLVLEHFPEVFKVKCFSNLQSDDDRLQPGKILLVVVPRQAAMVHMDFKPMFNVMVLERIRGFVLERSSPHLSLEVRNPVYEQIQVRCGIAFTPQAQILRGQYLNQLNQVIVDYLSPWTTIGYQARFGWEIRRTDLESHIRQLEYVDFITKFSLLHITGDTSGQYRMEDTARSRGQQPNEENNLSRACIMPRFPWSLAIPLPRHNIEIIPNLQSLAAEVTGIDQLQVGQTFIIDS